MDAKLPPHRGRRGRQMLLILALLLPGAYVFRTPLFTAIGLSQPEADYAATFPLETVSRGSFRVTLTDRGELESMRNVELDNDVAGTTTIIDIVPEGTTVHAPLESRVDGVVERVEPAESLGQELFTIAVKGQDGNQVDHLAEMYEHTRVLVEVGDRVQCGDYLAGDVVCELDASNLVELEKQRQIRVINAQSRLKRARTNVELQENRYASKLAAAELKRDLAQLDFEKYRDGDFEKTRDRLAGSLRAYQAELAKNQETYEFSKRNARKGYIPLKQLEEARLAVLKTENQLAAVQQQLRVLEQYDYERQIAELEATAKECVRVVERVKLAGEAAMAQFLADLKAYEYAYNVELEKLDYFREQIAACLMVAPQDGEVVYASNGRNLRPGQPGMIGKGETVFRRQTIIKLPDLSRMKIDVRVHESKIAQLHVGQRALIRIDAMPDDVLWGEVSWISSVPMSGGWRNRDVREYAVEIRITDDLQRIERLKPGLTADIEIISEDPRPDVLQMPVKALVTIGDRHFTYRIGPSGPERVELMIGSSNDKMVEIVDGLSEGDRVVLQPQKYFQAELSALESELVDTFADYDLEDVDAALRGAEASAPSAADPEQLGLDCEPSD